MTRKLRRRRFQNWLTASQDRSKRNITIHAFSFLDVLNVLKHEMKVVEDNVLGGLGD